MKCRHCKEPILPGEQSNDGLHIECLTRITAGSVGHQMGVCACYGGDMDDPSGMSVRQAAKAAFLMNQRARIAELARNN